MHVMPSGGPGRPTVFIPYWVALPLLLVGLAAFLATIALGVLTGIWLVVLIGSALAAWHIVLGVRLMRMGPRDWDERASR